MAAALKHSLTGSGGCKQVPEEYVFILDTDMLLRRPFLPSELHVRPGRAASAACASFHPCCPVITEPWPMMRTELSN